MDYKTLLRGVSEFKTQEKEAYGKVLEHRSVWGNLHQITATQTQEVAIGFLKDYRVRNTKRINAEDLKEKLQELSGGFEKFHCELVDLELTEGIEATIKEIYSKLDEVHGVGPTAISKILHGTKPNLFIMWDQAIREGYGYVGNEVGYLKFLKESQQILKEVLKTYPGSEEDLCNEAYPTVNKSLIKLLDEYNFEKFTKGRL